MAEALVEDAENIVQSANVSIDEALNMLGKTKKEYEDAKELLAKTKEQDLIIQAIHFWGRENKTSAKGQAILFYAI